jgi:hypothetical protein
MTSVEEVVAAWRDAERLLEDLPPIGTDHETVATVIASLRVTYARVTDESIRTSPMVIAETRQTIASSRDLLSQVRSKAHCPGGSA